MIPKYHTLQDVEPTSHQERTVKEDIERIRVNTSLRRASNIVYMVDLDGYPTETPRDYGWDSQELRDINTRILAYEPGSRDVFGASDCVVKLVNTFVPEDIENTKDEEVVVGFLSDILEKEQDRYG